MRETDSHVYSGSGVRRWGDQRPAPPGAVVVKGLVKGLDGNIITLAAPGFESRSFHIGAELVAVLVRSAWL